MKKLVIYILGSAALFSTMEVALKVAVSQMDAFQLTLIRFTLGGLFLFPFAFIEIRKKQTVITKKDMLHMLVMGIICICISMVFFQLGVEKSKASTAAVIFCINPMFTMLFAHFITDEKLNRIKVIVLAFGLLGILFMINPLNMEQGNTPLGVIYTIISAATFGLYSAVGKTSIHRLHGITQTSISFILGSVVLFPVLLILQRPVVNGITIDNIWIIMYISVMITGIGYLFYFLAMDYSDAATASIIFFVKPAIAPIFAVILVHERIELNGLIGIILILIGSYINLREQKRKQDQADELIVIVDEANGSKQIVDRRQVGIKYRTESLECTIMPDDYSSDRESDIAQNHNKN